MANTKTTAKSKTKSGSKSRSTVKTNPIPLNNPVYMKPGKAYNKQVTKKDGKVIATYQKLNQTGLIDRTSKVRKIFDNKGNLIKGNERINTGYGSYYDIGIKGSKKAAPIKKTTPKPSAPAKTAPKKTSTPKYVEPGTKEYNAMTPDQRNANTMLNIKESISGGPKKTTTTKKSTTSSKPTPRIAKAPEKKPIVSGKNVTSKEGAAKIKGIVEGLERPTAKKTTTKAKPVAPKMATTIGSAKVSVPSKGKVKIEANTGKPKSFTAPKTETKAKVQTAPKPEPKPEPIRMETIPLATVAKQLSDSQREKLPSTIETPKSVATTAKTPAPAEEKKGLFARLREKREARKAEKEAEKNSTAKMKKGGIMKKYKTGGMVNPNANLQAGKKAGSKGVKHSLSAKAIVQKIAKGKSGGTSAAPKTATPKAQYGMSMTKMKKSNAKRFLLS